MTEIRTTGRRTPASRARRLLAAMLAVLVAPIAMSLVASAGADTVGTPDPTVTATVGSQTNVAPNTTALTGLRDGSPVSITVTAPGNLAGVDARQCWGGAQNIQFQASFNPTQGGNCVDAPLSASSDDFISSAVGPPNNTTTFTFRVGTGSRTVTFGANTRTITCDATSDCTLWLKVAVFSGGDSAGAVWKHYNLEFAGPPTAPQNVTATPSSGAASVSWTAPADNGNAPVTHYDVTVTDGVTPVTQTVVAPTTTASFTGLSSFTPYTATVVARNTAVDGFQFSSPASAPADFTILEQGPTNLSASPGNQQASLTWTAAPNPPTRYEVVYCARALPSDPACTPGTVVNAGTGTTFTLTGLTNGTRYDMFVRAVFGTSNSNPSNTVDVVVGAASNTQTITVRRPQGALVLTQVCGARGATTTGTAPTFNGGPDPLFPQYPYPVVTTPGPTEGNAIANYPTDCGVQLGTASLVFSPEGVQHFQAAGNLHQVSVVDTRDADAGWNVTGTMGAFTSGANSFSGSHLGWTPIKTFDSAAFDSDLDGTIDYDQTVVAGSAVLPSTPGGLGNGETWASAAAGSGLGLARLDADIVLNIPITNNTGTYTGVLTITAL